MKKDLGRAFEVNIRKTRYSVIGFCKTDNKRKCYVCNFLLKDNDTSQVIVMDDYDDVKVGDFDLDECDAICKFIYSIVETGEILKYVNRMSYFDKCFNVGNKQIERRNV